MTRACIDARRKLWRPGSSDRLDLHDSQVDQEAAAARLWGVVDLRTGLTWTRPERKSGPCGLVPREEPRRRAEVAL